MKARLILIATVCVLAAQAHAQDATPAPAKPTPRREWNDRQIAVEARAEARPALRYQLRFDPDQQKPGNAALMYYLAADLAPNMDEKMKEKIELYRQMPLADLPQDDVARMLDQYDSVIRHLKHGAMRKEADWGLAFEDGVAMLLPSLNRYRDFAKVLCVKARLEMARGEYDQAVDTLKVLFTMAKQGTETLIGSLVGIAIQSLACEQVEELITAGGPNMYWALADVSGDLVDIRTGLAAERNWITATLPELDRALGRPMSQAEVNRMLDNVVHVIRMGVGDSGEVGGLGRLAVTALVSRYYSVGKQSLIDRGQPKDVIEAMPASQVVAAYLYGDYAYWRDEMFKWFELPYAQAREGLEKAGREFDAWRAGPGMLNPLTTMFPSLSRAYELQARSERSVAALQTLEAIRAYAAEHGALPETLDALDLPAAMDPITGKAFEYSVDGETFTLIGPAPAGDNDPKAQLRYQVTVTQPDEASRKTWTPQPQQTPAEALAKLGPWRGIAPYLSDETLAVVRLDLQALTSEEAWKNVSGVANEVLPEEDAAKVLPDLQQVRAMAQGFVAAGARELFVVVDVTNFPDPPMMVLTLTEPEPGEMLPQMVKGLVGRSPVRQIPGALVIASDGQLSTAARQGNARPDLVKMIADDKGAVQIAFAFSEDMRRAIEETLPILPQELGGLPGTTISRGLQWATLSIGVQKELSLDLVMQAPDAQAAADLKAVIDAALASKTEMLQHAGAHRSEVVVFSLLVDPFVPQLAGDRLERKFDQAALVTLLRDNIVPAFERIK